MLNKIKSASIKTELELFEKSLRNIDKGFKWDFRKMSELFNDFRSLFVKDLKLSLEK